MNPKTSRNLPKSDRNERLERLSNRALDALLPVEKFLPREDKPDKGVDSSIEVIDENEDFTNFRAQIQLKGTYSQKINKDGSVSFSIETSNIRYLWNNLISIYMLYIEPRKELRFVWLKDEIKRLNKENPDWHNQGEVTLKFEQILNVETADQIHEQITKESLLHRTIKEVFNINSDSNFRIELNPSSLEITDPKQARDFLIYHNVELLNAGYENLIIEKFNLLSESDKRNTNLLLLKAAAEDRKGNYKTALDTLGSIELLGQDLSERQKQFFEMTENNCSWKIGILSNDKRKERLKELSEGKMFAVSLMDRFNYLSHDFHCETNPEERIKKLTELENLVDEILKLNEVSEKTKIGIQVTFLGFESEQFLSEYIYFYLDAIVKLKTLLTSKTIYLLSVFKEIQIFNKRNITWYEKANYLLNITDNPSKQAEIGQNEVRHWLNCKRYEKLFFECLGQEFEFPLNELEDREKRINTVIEIFMQLGKNYEIVQAKGMLAELHSFAGRNAEAEKIREKNNVIAEKMSYKNLIFDAFIETQLKDFLNKYKF